MTLNVSKIPVIFKGYNMILREVTCLFREGDVVMSNECENK